MKFNIYIIIIISLFISSCQREIEGDSLDNWVQSNDYESIRDWIYNKRKLDSKKLEKIVGLYSKAITSKNLKAKQIEDNSFKKLMTGRKRSGYEYYDEEGNLHYSITYKLITMPDDSSKLFNYIDFRATDQDLPSLKVPSFLPIRSIYTAENINNIKKQPAMLDSLRAVGNLDLYGYQFKHIIVLNEENKIIPKDSIKSAIVFNINNNWVKKHIDLIIKGLEKEINMSQYDLAYMETVSTPTVRLGFDTGFNPEDLLKMMKFFEQLADKKIIVAPLFKNKFVPFKGNFYVGHSVVDKKKIRF
ncbi:MAG: hypothetical protein ACJATI_002916 [Halioglobus sp.]|jgi:hypothetical protein